MILLVVEIASLIVFNTSKQFVKQKSSSSISPLSFCTFNKLLLYKTQITSATFGNIS